MSSVKDKVLAALENLKHDQAIQLEKIIDTIELKGHTLTLKVNLKNLAPDKAAQFEANLREAIKPINEITKLNIENLLSEADSEPKRPQASSYFHNFKNVILVASGKGGVGKSTCALNLALALSNKGHKVAIFDADIYGPSIPLMVGMRGFKPKIVGNKLEPLKKFGLEFMSIGCIMEEGEAAIWRGPIVHQALEQLMRDTDFSEGDYMIIDMPPGTGDVQLTLSQLVTATGAVIVCTSQDVALIDARRAMAMFGKVNIPILGMVENMSGFHCPHCREAIKLFGQGGVETECRNLKLNFLGAVDLDPEVTTSSDRGQPIVFVNQDSATAASFFKIADNLTSLELVEKTN